ncbi:MAG: carbohydrate binding family 9 domain-containing protein [Acidobacteriota bacterium]|nr:MAG: carbohydrate binding family 9 domain-containing protein [Acidobacteriota bacterium]
MPRIDGNVQIDGRLEEPFWSDALHLQLSFEVFPADNRAADLVTDVRIAYDKEQLLVAFRAQDGDPSRVRAFYSDRDQAVREDLVGFIIDPFNDRRRGLLFLVNPMGVQLDAAIDEVVGTGGRNLVGAPSEDYTWDAIWHSAGKLTADGFVVEIAVPFSSLRFPQSLESDEDQAWGFMAFRAQPRTQRRRMASVPIDRDRSCFLCQAGQITGLRDIRPGRDIELDPTLTARRTDQRAGEDPSEPIGRYEDTDVGLSARWGITPDLSLNATLNPDFSQVEADVAQLEVNRRFALFFPEKRPFFLEAQDFFRTPLFAVFTRSVVEPDWGLKLTGKQGRSAVGTFLTQDAVTTLVFPGSQSSSSTLIEQHSQAGVLRYRRDVGETSTLGALVTDRRGDGYTNRVYGIDGAIRLSDVDRVQFQYLRSQTRYPELVHGLDEDADGTLDSEDFGQSRTRFEGSATTIGYEHRSRHFAAWAGMEDLSRGFRADLGFMPRVDLRRAEAGIERIHWGDGDGAITQIRYGLDASRAENQEGELLEQRIGGSVRINGPWQSVLVVGLDHEKQAFDGEMFDQNEYAMFYNIRPSGVFTHSLRVSWGDAIDFVNTASATRLAVEPEMTLNLGRHFFTQLRHNFERLDVAGGRLFRANLFQGNFIYHFTVRSFLRLILQYRDLKQQPELFSCTSDPVEPCTIEQRERRAFSQLLFSYKLNPRTVLFVGYSDNRSADGDASLDLDDRTLFLKLGYAWLL